MKHLNTNAEYVTHAKTLAELMAAESAAAAEESKLLALLAAPNERESVLAAATRMLRGEPAAVADPNGLNRQLDDVRGKLSVLRPAIEQQRTIVASITAEASAAICAQQAPEHLDAVQGLADALEATRAALYRLDAQREAIETAGFRCTFEVIKDPALSFDEGSAASRVLAQCHTFIALHALRQGPAVNVHVLAACGLGLPGDVVGKVAPAMAAELVRLGQAEVTQAKPHRVQRLKPWETAEVVLS